MFDVAELFTARAKFLFAPIDPDYIADSLTQCLEQVVPHLKYAVKWTGKRFAASKDGLALHGKNYETAAGVKEMHPEFYAAISMLNRARLQCFAGQSPGVTV